MKQIRKRREQDGLYLDNSEHWEMWETKVYSKAGPKRNQFILTIPADVARHLKLENKDLVFAAIKRREGKS